MECDKHTSPILPTARNSFLFVVVVVVVVVTACCCCWGALSRGMPTCRAPNEIIFHSKCSQNVRAVDTKQQQKKRASIDYSNDQKL